MYSLAAVGFALVYNTTGIFHIAAAAVYTAAAYFFYFAAHTWQIPLWSSAVLALVCAAMLNVACELAVYRPLLRRGATKMVVMLASIGLMIAIINVIALIFGNEVKIIDNSIQPSLHLGSVILSHPQAIQLSVAVPLLVAFVLFWRRSAFGLQTYSLGNNPVLFDVFGFDTGKTRLGVFLFGGFFLSASSCLSAYDIGLSPHGGMAMLINAMVAMIIGGIGRFSGCIAGGLLLGILQALVVWQFAANWQNAITFLLLIIFLFFRPQGLLGLRKRIV